MHNSLFNKHLLYIRSLNKEPTSKSIPLQASVDGIKDNLDIIQKIRGPLLFIGSSIFPEEKIEEIHHTMEISHIVHLDIMRFNRKIKKNHIYCTIDPEKAVLPENYFKCIIFFMHLHITNNIPTMIRNMQTWLCNDGILLISSLCDTTLIEMRTCLHKADKFVPENLCNKVHPSIASKDCIELLTHLSFTDIICEIQTLTMFFIHFEEIINFIRKSIAMSILYQKNYFIRQSTLQKIQAEYEKFRNKKGLPVSCDILFLHARKKTFAKKTYVKHQKKHP